MQERKITERPVFLAIHWYWFSLMNELISTQNCHLIYTFCPISMEPTLFCIGEILAYFNENSTVKDYKKEKIREFYLLLFLYLAFYFSWYFGILN